MKVSICDSRKVAISGVKFCHFDDCTTHKETYFKCTPFGLSTSFGNTDRIVCGLLEGWHHVPTFSIMETHENNETFIFTDGVALMPFCDIVNGKPDYSSAVIVRIEAGTQVEVAAGKAHFVAVAERDYFRCLVYCPNQEAKRIILSEPIESCE